MDERARSDQARGDLALVAGIVGAPEFLLPWLDRFYDADDLRVVLATARSGDGPGAAGDPAHGGPSRDVLVRAFRRGVLDRDEAGAYAPASFHARLDIWAMFEDWKDVPPAVRRRLAAWELASYVESIRPAVDALRAGQSQASDTATYSYLLLSEAEALIAAEPHVYLWPCDCRAIVGKCRKPTNACLRFANERGIGWEISQERALEILRAADRAGLMHTDYLDHRPGDAHAICNCCTDCCFPHLATELLDSGAVWPLRRHRAEIDAELCSKCGRCVHRCPFGAIAAEASEVPRLDASACRGCGLCATACTPAIAMLPLAP